MNRLILFLCAFALLSCSDQPEQKANNNFVIPNPISGNPHKKGVGTFGEEGGEIYILDHVYGRVPTEIRDPRVSGDNSEDDKLESNGKKPIVFNGLNPLESSVAGVQFNMSYDEASEILSHPIIGACGSSGDYYRENLCMLWSDDEPRRLRQVMVLNGYLGLVDLGGPIGEVRIKTEVPQHFKTPLGEELIVATYNKFFSKDEGFNCLESQDCQAVFYNDYINWLMPNVTVIFSKDRKALIGVIVNQDVQPLGFANPLDLIKGQIDLPNGEALKLGEAWSKVREQAGFNPAGSQKNPAPHAILETSDYRKDFVGMLARIERAGAYGNLDEFKVDQTEPQGSEVFKEFLVYSNYRSPIKMNGKFIAVKQKGKKLKLKLVSKQPEASELLSVRMDWLAGDIQKQKQLLNEVARLLKKELIQQSSEVILDSAAKAVVPQEAWESLKPNFQMVQRFFGYNARQAPNRALEHYTNFYDFRKKRSLQIRVRISFSTASLLYSVTLDSNPFTPQIMEASKSPVDLRDAKLAGFELGEKVKLTNIDREKNEAFLHYKSTNARVKVDLYSSTTVAFHENEGNYTREKVIEVSNLSGMIMGLSPLSLVKQETSELEAEIVMLASSKIKQELVGLCATEKEIKLKLSQSEFLTQLKDLLKHSENSSSCQPFVRPDESGAGEGSLVFFPSRTTGYKVNFIENSLMSVSKYKKALGY